jgi:hypothetical protein
MACSRSACRPAASSISCRIGRDRKASYTCQIKDSRQYPAVSDGGRVTVDDAFPPSPTGPLVVR